MKRNGQVKAEPAEPAEQNYQVPNLERALTILETLAQDPGGLLLSELAERLAYPKNSVFRITMTLLKHGYLSRHAQSKRFLLTRKLLALGLSALGESSLLEQSIETMRALRDATRETVLLGTLLDDDLVVIEQAPGLHSFKFLVDPGTRVHLHTSAPGKALLAALPERECAGLLDRLALTRYNERTITTRKQMEASLKRTRRDGYATDLAEEFDGIHCVGAAIRDQAGYPVGAIWITCPSNRLPESMFAAIGPLVREHAEIISHRMGYGLLETDGD